MAQLTIMAPVDSKVGLRVDPNDIHIMRKERHEKAMAGFPYIVWMIMFIVVPML